MQQVASFKVSDWNKGEKVFFAVSIYVKYNFWEIKINFHT